MAKFFFGSCRLLFVYLHFLFDGLLFVGGWGYGSANFADWAKFGRVRKNEGRQIGRIIGRNGRGLNYRRMELVSSADGVVSVGGWSWFRRRMGRIKRIVCVPFPPVETQRAASPGRGIVPQGVKNVLPGGG